MAYILHWKNAAPGSNKSTGINIPVGSVVSDQASIRFTGKGAPGYGSIQQENLMQMLENFADSVEPLYPTMGQEWFDTNAKTLRICTGFDGTGKALWKSLGGIQVTNSPPNPASLGDIWFQATGSNAGVLYMYTGTGRYPTAEGATTIGGWNQVWPTVETVAGREEYESLSNMVNDLIGSTGANAIGKNVAALTNLTALDADLATKTTASNGGVLKVDVTSFDWDLLLAAAKYAVSRLDLPAGMADDISPVPFVSDGRPAPASLLALPNTDVRYPSLDRRSNRRFGTVTLIRTFSETYNVLKAALANRYSIKGINGATGTNTVFDTNTEVVSHASFSGSPAGATSETITMQFRFASATDLQSFLNSGGAIQIRMSHTLGGASTTADADVRDLFNARGVMRFTADKTRVMTNVVAPALAVAPTSPGLLGAPAGGQALTSQTVGGATVSVAAGTVSATQLSITVTVTATGPINGTTAIAYQVIRDNTTYAAPATTRVFGAPNAYAAGDKTGSSFLV